MVTDQRDKWRPSDVQREILIKAASGDRIRYSLESDPSMNALARRGMAEWHNRIGQKYGRSTWWITDEGVKRGREFASAKGASLNPRNQ